MYQYNYKNNTIKCKKYGYNVANASLSENRKRYNYFKRCFFKHFLNLEDTKKAKFTIENYIFVNIYHIIYAGKIFHYL